MPRVVQIRGAHCSYSQPWAGHKQEWLPISTPPSPKAARSPAGGFDDRSRSNRALVIPFLLTGKFFCHMALCSTGSLRMMAGGQIHCFSSWDHVGGFGDGCLEAIGNAPSRHQSHVAFGHHGRAVGWEFMTCWPWRFLHASLVQVLDDHGELFGVLWQCDLASGAVWTSNFVVELFGQPSAHVGVDAAPGASCCTNCS